MSRVDNLIARGRVVLAILVVVTVPLAVPVSGQVTEEQRIDRLEMLADLWGKLWLFHPSIVTTDIDWDQVLVAAIPKVESARSTDELVEVLNKSLLAELDDPLSVVLRTDKAPPPGSEPQLAAKRLSADVGYVNASNPNEYWEGDFLKRFRKAVSELGDVATLIVDLRFRWEKNPWVEWTEKAHLPNLLRWFVDREVETGGRLLRIHRGWNQNNAADWAAVLVYDQKWDVVPGPILRPYHEACAQEWYGPCATFTPQTDLSSIKATVVFVVNNTSMPLAAQGLDSLQSQGRAVVIWERRGSFPDRKAVTEYPDGITAYLNIDPVMSPSGNLGMRPDYTSDQPLSEPDLLRLANELEPRRTPPGRGDASFPLGMRFPSIEEFSTQPLSREQRLLGLFKTWVVISRFFPHLEHADIDWANLLDTAISKVEAAEGSEEYYRTLQRLTAPLNDSHIKVRHRSMRPVAQLPVSLFWVEGKLVVVARAEGLGLEDKIRIGDEVIAIDGRSAEEVMAGLSPLISSSTPGAHRRELAIRAQWRDTDAPARLRLDGPDGVRDVEVASRPQNVKWDVNRSSTTGKPDPAFEVLPGNLGYIKLSRVRGSEDEAMDAVEQTRGLILDARGGPGNHRFVRFIVNQPMKRAIVEVPIVSGQQISYMRPEREWLLPDETRQYRKPVVVLINEWTQSSGENVWMAMRDSGRVTFVGTTTAGTNGNVSRITLPDGGYIQFTGMRMKFANGDPFQNIGIIPDVEAHRTIEDIRAGAGRDAVLEKGVEVLKRKISDANAADR